MDLLWVGRRWCSLSWKVGFGPGPKIAILVSAVTRQTAMPIRTAPRFCLGGCGRFEKLLYGCRDPSRLHVSDPWPVSDTHKQCVVETGQMSSAETGQMSAVETGQMSAAETGQMSAVETR